MVTVYKHLKYRTVTRHRSGSESELGNNKKPKNLTKLKQRNKNDAQLHGLQQEVGHFLNLLGGKERSGAGQGGGV